MGPVAADVGVVVLAGSKTGCCGCGGCGCGCGRGRGCGCGWLLVVGCWLLVVGCWLLLLLLLLLSSLLLLLVTPDQSSGTVQLQCMGGCHHGGRWCGDTPLRTLGANARDAGYDSKGDALRRLAGCAPILRGSGSAAEGTWGHARQHRRPKGRREIPGRAPAASAPAGGGWPG